MKLFIWIMITTIIPCSYSDYMLSGQAVDQADPVGLSDSSKAVLGRLLPSPEAVSAKVAGAPLFFSHDLWDYIDGGADVYQAQGFSALVHQDYKAGDAEITVDIYDMGNPVQAFGMYAWERAPEYQFLEIGLEGHGDEFGLNFFQDQYYVKLSIFSSDDSKNMQIMTAFAESISGQIGPEGNWPSVLSLFPDSLRISHSEKYIRQAPMGHPFLAPVYSVQYASGDSVSTLWLSECESEKDAVERAEKLAAHFRETGSIEHIEDGWIGYNTYEGMMIFIPKSNYLILLQNPFHGAEMLLSSILERIQGLLR